MAAHFPLATIPRSRLPGLGQGEQQWTLDGHRNHYWRRVEQKCLCRIVGLSSVGRPEMWRGRKA
jgi:hypothetical protein